jgi:anti-sigma regulatory factor (Ser/Thr protein kinase)
VTAERDGSATAAGSGPAAGLLLEQSFDRAGLISLRNAVAAHVGRLGLPEETVAHVVLAVYELASNAVRHGGGRGRLRMSVDDGVLRCAVHDEGAGFPDPGRAGRVRPDPTASGGRGLWLVRCVSDRLEIRTDPAGMVATVEFALG